MTLNIAIATPPGQPTIYRALSTAEQTIYDDKQTAYETNKLSNLKLSKIKETKQEARKRIEINYPGWKQRNILSSSINIIINNNDPSTWASTLTEFISSDSDIIAIRNNSDTIETSINAMDYATLEIFDITDNSLWI